VASIILPSRWTSQPQEAVEVDWGNPLSRGLVQAALPSIATDLVRKATVTRAPLQVRNGVMTASANGSYTPFTFPSPFSLSAAGSYTLLASVPYLDLVGTNPGLWRSGVSSDGGDFCIIQGGANRRPWIRCNGSDVLKPSSGPQLTVGQSVNIAFRAHSENEFAVFWDGVKQHTATSGFATGAATFNVIGWQSALSEYIGSIGGVWIWNRPLSDGELAEATRNPWQIFKKRPNILYFDVGGGATDYPLTADTGSFTPTGNDAGLTAQRRLSADAGSFALTGNDAGLTQSGTQRYGRPDADVAAGAWTASTGSDLFAMLDEETPADADYIHTASASTCEIGLSDATDPGTSSGQVLRYRARSDDASTLIAKLMEGATTIASRTHASVPNTWTEYTMTLTGGECDAITDYADLRVKLEAA